LTEEAAMPKSHTLTTVIVVAGLLAPIHGGSEARVIGGAADAAATGQAFAGDLLPFDDRIDCRRRIEDVYWQQRIWPGSNPGPKPALDDLLPESTLRERVASELQKSAALDVFWQRPLTGDQLQAELNRMARRTRNPDLLRELFAALDHDPYVIAECLARPVLVDRLARNWYARDARFHGAVRAEANAALAKQAGDESDLSQLGGEYRETIWRLATEEHRNTRPERERVADPSFDLDREQWNERVGHLAASFGIEPGSPGALATEGLLDAIPVNRRSPLIEEDNRFRVTVLLSREPDRVRVATVTWEKRPFDTWWAEEGRAAVAAAEAGAGVAPPGGGFELPAIRDDGCVEDTWTELWYTPVGSYGHTAVWTGAEMIVWGGGGNGFRNEGGRYEPATDTWAHVSRSGDAPSARSGHTAVWTGTEMIVWGGNYLRTGGRYDPLTDSWTATSTSGSPEERVNHTAVWTGSEMIVWGGEHYYIVGGWYYEYYSLQTGSRYDPSTDSWTYTPYLSGDGTPTRRHQHSAVWTGTEMIVWGGSTYMGNNEETYRADGGRFDPVANTWAPMSAAPGTLTPRIVHTAVWTGSEMIVWGGIDVDGRTNTGGRYAPGSDNWSATSTASGVPEARSGHTTVWTGAEMIVWGGSRASGSSSDNYLNTGGRYDPPSDSWTAISTGAGVLEPRRSHSAVWTGTEMIVWGGFTYIEGALFYLRTGGRYDPATDSWTATSTGAGVPQASEKHTAIWTGAEMIVWGGMGGFEFYLNSGGRYDPATATWTPTSAGPGVPTGREEHTAVWTGTEMIVWGGDNRDADDITNTGGRYAPSTDSWTATSTEGGTLTARRSHTAVWTGTEMIVWGGFDYSPIGRMNTGDRYDPLTDSWTPTSTDENVPSERQFHTAVWTGTEMIVWGGHGGLPQGPGGRYDPASDSWSPVSAAAGAPTARYDHTAVWTGTEMVIWGGTDSTYDPALRIGGRYDPVTNSWTPTSIGTNYPTARRNHTAVWTGTEMIVWGGQAQGMVNLTDGGRYDPATDSWAAVSAGAGEPSGRLAHTAAWSGREMVVWGGVGDVLGDVPVANGGLYCACGEGTVLTWYPDRDGDGYGVDVNAVPSCTQPPGYVTEGGDCDDTNPGAHTGSTEINDGLDNSCPGETGHGLVDEISGVCGFHNPADANEFSCPLQAGATRYEVARSPHREFPSQVGCLRIVSDTATWVDTDPVPEATCFYYLVRAHEPNTGSWGADSGGIERAVTCHR
jgi:N-acetylneuraminic acid mutarotase